MVALSDKQRRFLEWYQAHRKEYECAASSAEALVKSVVESTGVICHMVSSRAKEVDSLRLKLIEKQYNTPRRQVTDLVGVRVITYYDQDVDPVIKKLRAQFTVDKHMSEDKRSLLGYRTFGYRSVHLTCKLDSHRARSPEYKCLANKLIEIQVRSLLEHAWAEIDHELVYKAGVDHPDANLRRFAAIAAVLEILDRTFCDLRGLRDTLVDAHNKSYQNRRSLTTKMDVARLIAFLGLKSPNAAILPHGKEKTCLKMLRSGGITSAKRLGEVMSQTTFLREKKRYAAQNAIDPTQVSQLALAVICTALTNYRLVEDFLPDMLSDGSIEAIVSRAKKR